MNNTDHTADNTEYTVGGSNRRKFIAGVGGVLGTSAISGCLGDESPDDGDANGDGADRPDDSDDGDDTDDVDFPERDIEFIVPYGPGGGYDFYTRLIAEHIPKHLPNDVVVTVQNVEGAGGQIGTEQVYNSEPDGYTWMIVNVLAFVRQQIVQDVDYDVGNMTMLGQIAEDIGALAVGSNTDIHTWNDFVTGIQNEEFNIYIQTLEASGLATAYMTGAISGLYEPEKILDNVVVYDSRSDGLQGILAGDVQVMPGTHSSLAPYIESEDLRLILHASVQDEVPEPTNNPDAVTLSSAENPSIDNAEEIADTTATRRAFGGPPGIPEERVEIMRDAFRDTFEDDEFIAAAEDAGRPLDYADAETAETAIQNGQDQWSEWEDLLQRIMGPDS